MQNTGEKFFFSWELEKADPVSSRKGSQAAASLAGVPVLYLDNQTHGTITQISDLTLC